MATSAPSTVTERPSQEVFALAQQENLGGLVRTVHPKKETGRAVALIIMGVLSIVILVGFYFLWLAFQLPALNAKLARKRVYLFQYGLVEHDKQGALTAYRWDKISEVFQEITERYANGIKVATTYVYTVRRRDGAETKLTNAYDGIAELGPHICDAVARVRLPHVEAALSRGEEVRFGDLSLSRQGIGTKRGVVPWHEIEKVSVNNGYVSVSRAGKWLPTGSTPASKIPNLYLYLYVADQFLGTRR